MNCRFGMWCVGLCLLFAGPALAQSWTAVSPDGGRYRVEMPGTAKVSTAPIPVGPSQTVPMTEAEVRLGRVGYVASWVDYPERISRAASAELMLDRVRDGSSAGNTLRGEKKLTLGRFPGREYVIGAGQRHQHRDAHLLGARPALPADGHGRRRHRGPARHTALLGLVRAGHALNGFGAVGDRYARDAEDRAIAFTIRATLSRTRRSPILKKSRTRWSVSRSSIGKTVFRARDLNDRAPAFSKKNETGTSSTRATSKSCVAPMRLTPRSYFWICWKLSPMAAPSADYSCQKAAPLAQTISNMNIDRMWISHCSRFLGQASRGRSNDTHDTQHAENGHPAAKFQRLLTKRLQGAAASLPECSPAS